MLNITPIFQYSNILLIIPIFQYSIVTSNSSYMIHAMPTTSPRFAELDIARTLAILMMIVYHIAFDLSYFFGVYDLKMNEGGWKILQLSTVILFLILVGVSFVISWERTRISGFRTAAAIWKYLKRGLLVFCCAMLITIATYILDPSTYIRFGILHMIGISIILLPFFRRFREWNVLIGLLIIIIGYSMTYIQDLIINFQFQISNSQLFLPFGIIPPNFTTLDYYPLFPWFGIILIGVALGDFFYIRSGIIPKPTNKITRILSVPGRHALLIYLIHQPIILTILNIYSS